ncbi:cobaltochelatase subunit CobN [Thalassotalea marina]|uniref:CobN/magnesium chelatase domain-containing protein n=1 Tax=Thalassotalea marina TaxID=1673741 RepID=A0A919BAJ2_9GAMM|nr:cobaltochelatase subunit CobN [Thalassotalea marina]GHF77810.1 hypothetical protein GCM10017161_00990 [Thalassotalea marina]
MRILILLAMLFCQHVMANVNENYLLVLSSQRNAETIAEAARLFQLAHPSQQHFTIKARTDSQISAMSDQALAQLVNNSQGIIGIGLFGGTVAHLTPLFQQSKQDKIILNSDHRLVALSQINGVKVFRDQQHARDISANRLGDNFLQALSRLQEIHPQQSKWLEARSYWQAKGAENTAQLFAWSFHQLNENISYDKAQPTPQLRWYTADQRQHQVSLSKLPDLDKSKPIVAILDHAGGDRPADAKLIRDMCQQVQTSHDIQCISALAFWGEAGVLAAQELKQIKQQLTAIVMLQDFVIGGGEGREKVTEALDTLNVPVIKAIKLRDRSAIERQLSSDGLAHDKVYYQVAMPELQGASQPLVIATAGDSHQDPLTGIQVQGVVAEPSGITSVLTRVSRWHNLQRKANRDKKIAIIYYNHPPGRHNIGADNLDVPASLWQILNQLQKAGYHTGQLPASQEALLDLMQQQGINLPRDSAALANMSQHIKTMTGSEYQTWFNTLPETIKHEMIHGPFGLLHQQIIQANQAGKPHLAEDALHHTLEEMHHLLEGVDHKGRARALALLEQLEHCYQQAISEKSNQIACMSEAPKVITALQQTGIEGLGGWGEAPGKVMTYQGKLLFPGIQFGNIYIGPQPPRGWEINEELLHANLAFPPPHQYLAFYHFLQNQFKADAIVHLGRHSTYEFLPKRSVGLAQDDYSRIIGGDIPGVYPYIVDGVGEGIQAKRRGLAVMVDHLTPPLSSTPLYDQLLQLRQLIESFEASHAADNEVVEQRLVKQIRDKVDQLELKDEIAEAISAELAIMGISFEEVDDDMLVHEVGHYLTDLQERFMPLGLHIFGKDWQDNAIEMMLSSMMSKNPQTADLTLNSDNALSEASLKARLIASPQSEMQSLLNGLSGGYISPGPGNDPIRSPASLPTGRNFYALDSSLIPSRLAWQLGQEMAQAARKNNQQSADKREAVILWASDVVRDEGVMIAFGLDMLGLEPVWNSRGLVKGLKHQSLDNRVRRDVVFTTSGLFRDLYSQQMVLVDKAVLMALDASADTIKKEHPALSLALTETLAQLGKYAKGGNEPLSQNQVAAHWVKQTRASMQAGLSAKDAGTSAAYRVFGDAPGSYGAGINRLVERSGAWEKREELAKVYMRRLGHSYGLSGYGAPAQTAFKQALANVENTYFGRSSNLYGLIDNNDAFDYLGGLSLAIESITGQAPNNFVIDHADPNQVKTRPLGLALRQELRGRFLNPEWLKGQMAHGYAGARTMGNEFLEYLWGWQVTNPTLVGDWAWEEVKAIYIDDRYQLDLDSFLAEGHNAHVKSNMLALMLVAIQKEFWQASEQTIQDLAQQFSALVAQHGLPGSGHTDPDNPMLPWLEQHLSAQEFQAIASAIKSAKGDIEQSETEVHRISELTVEQDSNSLTKKSDTSQPNAASEQKSPKSQEQQAGGEQTSQWLWWLTLGVLLVIVAGFYRSKRQSEQLAKQLANN